MAVGKWILRNLASGMARKLTRYEVKQGCIDISGGKRLRNIAKVNAVEISGKVFVSRGIGSCGRVHVPPALLKSVCPREIRIRLAGARIRIELLEGGEQVNEGHCRVDG
ncbi:MAG: hypothetical protein NTU41_00180 [Chloroflexi bacterium]|nr:hypothetical protein [Chloroflexota bacterium]